MKVNKNLLFILIYSFFNISINNSPIVKRNLEPVNGSKRTLDEKTDNYIIIQFNTDVTFEEGKFLHNYTKYISYIINGDKGIYPNSKFTIKSNTKLEIHFNQNITSLENFFDTEYGNYSYLLSGDFCHFDTSLVTSMYSMFYGCSSLKSFYLSNFKT